MSSREQVLSAVRGAIRDAAAPTIPRDYNRDLGLDTDGLIELFAERVSDYRADVEVIKKGDVGRVIGNQLANRQVGSRRSTLWPFPPVGETGGEVREPP